MTNLQSETTANLTSKTENTKQSSLAFSISINSNKYIGALDRDFCKKTVAPNLIKNIDRLMDKGEVLKADETCYVSRTSWNGRDIVIKRYNNKGLIHSLRHTIKKSRARRAWMHANRLLALNIATPKPLAFFEQRKGLLILKSYLITEYIQGQRLKEFLRNDSIAQDERAIVIRKVTNLLDKLGKYCITHGDLKHSNILITKDGPALTDLDAMTIHKLRWIYRFKRTKDIARFQKKLI